MKQDRFISYSWQAVKALVTRSLNFENASIPIRLQNLSYRKIFNAIRIGMSISMKATKPWGWPTTLQIEPASLCNLQCALCPVTDGLDRPTGLMEFDLFKKTIDEIGDYALFLILWDWGEPFVNPAVYEMIRYAKKHNIFIISSTNAHMFAEDDNARKLIESGIDSIIISIDGIKQETYEHYRQKGKLETALKGVRNIVAARKAMDSQTPLITFRFIVTKHNENEISELKKLARTLGVDILAIKTLSPFNFYPENIIKKQKNYAELMPQETLYQRYNYAGSAGDRDRIRRKPRCTRMWDCLTVHWNGAVCLRTYDYKDQYICGNVKTDAIKNIWFDSPMRSLRRNFREDSEQIDLCRNCTNSFEGGACDGENVVEVLYNPAIADLFAKSENPEKVKPL